MIDEERVALIVWLRYYVETEVYDRTCEGFWIAADEWFPYAWTDARLRAARRRDAITFELRIARIPTVIAESAKRRAASLSFTRQREALTRLLGEDITARP